MNVAIERSALDFTNAVVVGFQDGDAIESPVINTTRAQTRVSAYDNQTVVFAGLISKQRTSISRGIPFLKDIPIAGALFRYDTEQEIRTELLVVMTPRIIQSPDELQVHNDVESSRMSWCLADVLNIHGDTTLQGGNGLWGPAASPVIFPDIEPAISFDPYGQPSTINGPVDSSWGPQPLPGNTLIPMEETTGNELPDTSQVPVEVAPTVLPMGYVAPPQGAPAVYPATGMVGNIPTNVGTPLQPINLAPQGPGYPN
jgi:hypothetical protein